MSQLKYSSLFAICFFSLSVASALPSNTQIGRYLTVANKITPYEENTLEQTFQVKFPASIQTVGNAINFILINTGYRFIAPQMQSGITRVLLSKPLPLPLRSLRPTTVEAGLLALIGYAYQLVLDPAHRIISVRLRPSFQSIYPMNGGGSV